MALRTRLLIAGLGVGLAVGLLVLFLALRPGETPFAQAMQHVDGENLKLGVKIDAREKDEIMRLNGTALQNADGTHSRFDVDAVYEEGDDPVRQTFLLIERDIWVGGDATEGVLPEGKRWLRSEEPETSPLLLNMRRLAILLARTSEVEEKGTTTIRGQQATHYQGIVDVKAIAESEGEMAEDAYAARLGKEALVLPVELWVGEDGRPVRVALKSAFGGNRLSYTADVLEYGPKVLVQTPPSDETITEAEFDRLTAE